jgi:hypothetical protein
MLCYPNTVIAFLHKPQGNTLISEDCKGKAENLQAHATKYPKIS